MELSPLPRLIKFRREINLIGWQISNFRIFAIIDTNDIWRAVLILHACSMF